MAERKSKQVLAAEKRRQEEQEAKNTLRRETKDATSVTGAGRYKKMYPHELGVVGNLKYQAEKGVKKAKEIGKKVVNKGKDMKAKAGKALKTLQNPTAAENALDMKNNKNKPTKKQAYGGKVKKMAKGGKLPMVKKDGKMVPAFAADGKGKMAYGGKVKKMADGGDIGRKIRNSKPVPMPKPKKSGFKSNMPQIDGEAREKAIMEKLKKSTPKRPKYDPKKILEEYRKKTGSSPSRRIASGGKVKKMAYGGSVKKTGARRGDGCAVKGKTRGRMV